MARRNTISAETPDWSREAPRGWWDPGRRLLRAIRGYQAAGAGPLGLLRRKFWALQHRFWSAVTSTDIPVTSQIEGGLLMPHPIGIVIHPEARIGPNCAIFQNATLGGNASRPGLPVLRGHVDVSPGAVVLGGITIGEHALIGANAVVLDDVPAGGIAVGSPARVVGSTFDED